jgi:hypothetical protein
LLSIRRATSGLPCRSGSSLAFTQSLFPEVFFFRLGILSFKTRILHRQSECSNSHRPRYIFIHSPFTGLRKFWIMLYHHPPIEKTHRKRRCVADQSISALNMPPQIWCFAGLMWLELSLCRSGHTVICAFHTSLGV